MKPLSQDEKDAAAARALWEIWAILNSKSQKLTPRDKLVSIMVSFYNLPGEMVESIGTEARRKKGL